MELIEQLATALRSLNVTRGCVVLFEAPTVDPRIDFNSLLASLKQAIGPEGTLVIPTCTAEEGYPKPTFDPVLSASESGPFSEFFRQQDRVLRSHNPTHSVAAFGPLAVEITAGHRSALGRQTPWGEGSFGHGSPWDVITRREASWVGLDVAWESSPFMAYLSALFAECKQGITKEMPFPRFDAATLIRALEEKGVLLKTFIGGLRLEGFPVQLAIAQALDLLEKEAEQLKPDQQFRNWLATVAEIHRQGYLQAGTARMTISPKVPCRRWDGKPLTGIFRNLYARILVLQRGSQKAALVVCDLLGTARLWAERIRAEAEKLCGLPASSIMIASSHAHSTPDTIGAGNEDPEYLEWMIAQIAAGIQQASERLQPARLGWDRALIRGLAQSRRVRLKDGKVFTTRYGVPSTWRVRAESIADHGPLDPDLTTVRVENLDGEVLAVISNFGCHSSVALMSPNVSGDYLGEAAWALEQALGGQVVALLTNGTAADIDPTLEMPFWGPRTDANARRLGRIFAAQVLECQERVKVIDDPVLCSMGRRVVLPVRAEWLRLIQEEQARLRQEFASAAMDNAVIAPILREQTIQTEVQVLRLNDLFLAGLPGEVFTTTGLKIKAGVPGGRACIVELANDCLGYIPTPEAFREGGYEIGPHFYTRMPPEAESVLLGVVAELISSLQ